MTEMSVKVRSRLSTQVSVVQKDVGLLHRGEDVRAHGVNLVILDAFDASLVGHNAVGMLELARRQVAQPGARVIPSKATVYCMGIEVCECRAGCPDAASSALLIARSIEEVQARFATLGAP